MATSIWASAGRRVLSNCVAEHRCERDSPRQRRPDFDEPANDLVRHGGDDRDEQDLADQPDRRRQQSERREDADADQGHDDEKPGAAAGMETAARTHVGDIDSVAELERVDRHVLGAVILKEPANVAGSD